MESTRNDEQTWEVFIQRKKNQRKLITIIVRFFCLFNTKLYTPRIKISRTNGFHTSFMNTPTGIVVFIMIIKKNITLIFNTLWI